MMSADANRSFTVAAGYRLHLRRIDHSMPGEPTLVFLHEGLGTIRIWGDFPDALCRATGCPGLIYERPGYGASDPRETFSIFPMAPLVFLAQHVVSPNDVRNSEWRALPRKVGKFVEYVIFWDDASGGGDFDDCIASIGWLER